MYVVDADVRIVRFLRLSVCLRYFLELCRPSKIITFKFSNRFCFTPCFYNVAAPETENAIALHSRPCTWANYTLLYEGIAFFQSIRRQLAEVSMRRNGADKHRILVVVDDGCGRCGYQHPVVCVDLFNSDGFPRCRHRHAHHLLITAVTRECLVMNKYARTAEFAKERPMKRNCQTFSKLESLKRKTYRLLCLYIQFYPYDAMWARY